jgi:hypothetical protein
LWNDISIVDTSYPEDEIAHRREAAARRVAILVDYLGAHSVSEIQFIADDSLGQLRTEEEALLADLIRQLHALYEAHRPTDRSAGSGWDQVRKFLGLFPQAEQ